MKTVLITGGTGGLGTAVVARLERDYRCVLLTRDDLANETAIRTAMERTGEFYGLVHLVGGFAAGAVRDTSANTLNEMLESNTTVAFLTIHEALRTMQRPGRIIAISSIASIQKPAGIAAYAVSKSALNTLIEVTAKEIAGSGITANALLPDSLDTPGTRKSMPDAKLFPAL
ncbi:MAG: hypothetical protein DMF58_19005 [Acidobacteria bacterium]|nr:MAG: hypothetical protein DMF58_19005 [Acidobacteriota bacterium]